MLKLSSQSFCYIKIAGGWFQDNTAITDEGREPAFCNPHSDIYISMQTGAWLLCLIAIVYHIQETLETLLQLKSLSLGAPILRQVIQSSNNEDLIPQQMYSN